MKRYFSIQSERCFSIQNEEMLHAFREVYCIEIERMFSHNMKRCYIHSEWQGILTPLMLQAWYTHWLMLQLRTCFMLNIMTFQHYWRIDLLIIPLIHGLIYMVCDQHMSLDDITSTSPHHATAQKWKMNTSTGLSERVVHRPLGDGGRKIRPKHMKTIEHR